MSNHGTVSLTGVKNGFADVPVGSACPVPDRSVSRLAACGAQRCGAGAPA
nr:MAG: hypothetical protein DIU75_21450 [Mycolicibacterium hassiacum]